MTARRMKRARRSGRGVFVAAAAMFAVACGLVLILVQSGGDEALATVSEASAAPETMARDRVMEGLEHARRAQRALDDGNYGSAREHLAQVEDSLTKMLADQQ